MSIERIGSNPLGRLSPRGRNSVEERPEDESAPSQQRSQRADTVGFSAEGLALAEQARSVGQTLSAHRMAQIETRIANGFYDDPSVAESVAHRILDSGDLD